MVRYSTPQKIQHQIIRSDEISCSSCSDYNKEQEDSRDENNYYLATTARKLNKITKSSNKKNPYTSSNWSCNSSIDDNLSTSKASIASSPAVVTGRRSSGTNYYKEAALNKDDHNAKNDSNSVKSSKSNHKFIFLKKSKSLKTLRSFTRRSRFRRSKKTRSALSTGNLDMVGDNSINDKSLRSKVSQSSNANTCRRSKSHASRASARKLHVLHKAPSAKDAAFSGPPRYDWIDIESAAAIKIQALVRKILVMNDLEQKGMLTKHMKKTRNAKREIFMKVIHASKRSYANNEKDNGNNQSPFFSFSLCSALDHYMLNSVYSFDKERNRINQEYQQKKKMKELEEATKRKYHHLKSKPSLQVLEEYEVLDVKS